MTIKLSTSIIKQAIKESKSMRDMLLLLGLSATNGNYDTYRRFIDENKIDIHHWIFRYGKNQKQSKRKTLDEWMQKDTVIVSSTLKKKILRAKLFKEECVICGLQATWQNKKLVLVLDHINGDNSDNRKENLRFLCPNCNSQQPTFCRSRTKKEPVLWECGGCKDHFPRNALNRKELCRVCRQVDFEKRKHQKTNEAKSLKQEKAEKAFELKEQQNATRVKKQVTCSCGKSKTKHAKRCQSCEKQRQLKTRKFNVTYKKLKALVWEMPTSKVGEMFGVSGKAIEKRCKLLGIEKPPRGYWAKQRAKG